MIRVEEIKKMLGGHPMERLRAEGTKDSAVLLPLVTREGKPHLLFEVREKSIAQGGEICFPGGRVEPGETPEDAAVRETAEELMISPSQIAIIAPLFEMIGPGGGSVWSYLGEVADYADTWQESEVERTFLLPIEWLLSVRPRTHKDYMTTVTGEDFPYELIPGGKNYPFRKTMRRFYFYETEYGVVWGLTGELLYHFLDAISVLLHQRILRQSRERLDRTAI